MNRICFFAVILLWPAVATAQPDKVNNPTTSPSKMTVYEKKLTDTKRFLVTRAEIGDWAMDESTHQSKQAMERAGLKNIIVIRYDFFIMDGEHLTAIWSKLSIEEGEGVFGLIVLDVAYTSHKSFCILYDDLTSICVLAVVPVGNGSEINYKRILKNARGHAEAIITGVVSLSADSKKYEIGPR